MRPRTDKSGEGGSVEDAVDGRDSSVAWVRRDWPCGLLDAGECADDSDIQLLSSGSPPSAPLLRARRLLDRLRSATHDSERM